VKTARTLGWIGILWAAPAFAQEVAPEGHCVRDALERWYCASDPRGTAVLDNLGAAVCAPGGCLEADDEWSCSSVAGGSVRRTAEGVVCEGGCRAPRSVECTREDDADTEVESRAGRGPS
jgi:hypothetical protein